MSFFAIMQGRLVPPEGGRFQCFPRERWRDEFALAARAGLNGIEWIFDVYGEDVNPLSSDSGTMEIASLSEQTGIKVRSLCADYFMDRPFLRVTESERRGLIHKLEWLLLRCERVGIGRVVIPFVDNSRIQNVEEKDLVVAVIGKILPVAERCHIELHLETSLAPSEFASLLDACPHPLVRVNYDSGNSASLGYKVNEEFATYGDRIGSVHIKDRKLGGGTVPLGTGDADLRLLFRVLASLGYQGDYILQIARSESGEEVPWITENLSWLAAQVESAKKAAL